MAHTLARMHAHRVGLRGQRIAWLQQQGDSGLDVKGTRTADQQGPESQEQQFSAHLEGW